VTELGTLEAAGRRPSVEQRQLSGRLAPCLIPYTAGELVPLSDSPQQTRPPQTRSESDSTFRIAPGARSSGRRTANVSPLAPMPTPATAYAALQDAIVPYMALSCAWRRRIHVGVPGSRGVLAYRRPEDPNMHTRCWNSSESWRELGKPSEHCAIDGLADERRQRRTRSVVEGHESGRLKLLYC
jgi:hypothetical protein